MTFSFNVVTIWFWPQPQLLFSVDPGLLLHDKLKMIWHYLIASPCPNTNLQSNLGSDIYLFSGRPKPHVFSIHDEKSQPILALRANLAGFICYLFFLTSSLEIKGWSSSLTSASLPTHTSFHSIIMTQFLMIIKTGTLISFEWSFKKVLHFYLLQKCPQMSQKTL